MTAPTTTRSSLCLPLPCRPRASPRRRSPGGRCASSPRNTRSRRRSYRRKSKWSRCRPPPRRPICHRETTRRCTGLRRPRSPRTVPAAATGATRTEAGIVLPPSCRPSPTQDFGVGAVTQPPSGSPRSRRPVENPPTAMTTLWRSRRRKSVAVSRHLYSSASVPVLTYDLEIRNLTQTFQMIRNPVSRDYLQPS